MCGVEEFLEDIAPVIIVVVIVLISVVRAVARAAQEQKNQRRDRTGAAAQRPAMDDVRKFLNEIQQQTQSPPVRRQVPAARPTRQKQQECVRLVHQSHPHPQRQPAPQSRPASVRPPERVVVRPRERVRVAAPPPTRQAPTAKRRKSKRRIDRPVLLTEVSKGKVTDERKPSTGRQIRAHLPADELKRAIVLAEILGPPRARTLQRRGI